MSNNTSNSKGPVYRKSLPSGISAAVFEHTRDGRINRSVNLQRSYRKDDSWNRMTLYLNHEDIPFVQEALKSVWEFLNSVPPSQTNDSDASSEGVA